MTNEDFDHISSRIPKKALLELMVRSPHYTKEQLVFAYLQYNLKFKEAIYKEFPGVAHEFTSREFYSIEALKGETDRFVAAFTDFIMQPNLLSVGDKMVGFCTILGKLLSSLAGTEPDDLERLKDALRNFTKGLTMGDRASALTALTWVQIEVARNAMTHGITKRELELNASAQMRPADLDLTALRTVLGGILGIDLAASPEVPGPQAAG